MISGETRSATTPSSAERLEKLLASHDQTAQRVEHYEIAGYGTARTYAELLGDNGAVKTLQQTLDEESATDEKLTAAAKKIDLAANK